MPTRINFRNDSPLYAEARAGATSEKWREWYADDPTSRDEMLATPPAAPGDLWRITWAHTSDEAPDAPDRLAGYAIACPRCLAVHFWTSANNCRDGFDGQTCKHSRETFGGSLSSCWQWTGSAEEGTLSATPSLFNSGGCGWHGYLTNGELREV